MTLRLLASVLLLAVTFRLSADPVRIFTTTADGKKQLAYTTTKSLRSKSTRHLTLQPSTAFQEMDGFGYAITYSACYNLLHMAPADRRTFLTRTYSRTEGYGVSYARISIGCSDFSSTEYSLCDAKGIANFRLHSDEKNYVIPILKEILSINPDLKIMAAPWTCPKWMKIESPANPESYDSWTGGTLNPACYDDYAEYFVRFVKAFEAEGIPIYAVTPQNEPLNRGNCASLYMPWAEEAAFVNKLAPAFAHAGIRTKIYCFDHNYNYDDIADQQDYPVKFYAALDPDMDGRDLVVGSAWHDYGGNVAELDDVNQKAPGREVIFTETSIGTWNDGRNLDARLLADMQNLVFNTLTRQSKAVMVWNFMLDLNRGPNLDGGCQTCYGAVDIDQNDYHTLSYNSHYFVMAHASLAAQPGARRIASSMSGSASDISHVAFLNPDGSYGAFFINTGSTSLQMTMSADPLTVARFTLPARSVVTVVLGGAEERVPHLGSTVIPSAGQHGTYKGTIQAVQWASMTQDFIGATTEDWHIAPDYFAFDASDSSLTFLPLSGKYTVEIDRAARTLLAAPVAADLTETGQGNIYVGGPARSIGRVFFYPSQETLAENATAMAEVEDGLYEYTFTVGEQVSDDAFDMAFFPKADLSEIFSGKTSSAYRLTYDQTLGSIYFFLGKGTGGHADGHLFKRLTSRRLGAGSVWTAVVDLRGGMEKATVYIRDAVPTAIGRVNANDAPALHHLLHEVGNGGEISDGSLLYDLNGHRIARSAAPGIYILHTADGRICKVLK